MLDGERGLKNAIFSSKAVYFDKMAQDRQILYRKLVRNNLINAVSSQLPLAEHHVGDKRLIAWIGDWLNQAPPQERIYWKLPIEFALWFHENAESNDRVFAELIHFEAMQVSCQNAPNFEGERTHVFSLDTIVEVDPSCRLCVYNFPVYLMAKCEHSLPAPLTTPDFVLLYRRQEEVYWMVLEAQMAQLIAQLSDGKTIQESITFISQLYESMDPGYLRAQLIKLNRQQILWWQPSCAK